MSFKLEIPEQKHLVGNILSYRASPTLKGISLSDSAMNKYLMITPEGNQIVLF